jgi:hypothetical protein
MVCFLNKKQIFNIFTEIPEKFKPARFSSSYSPPSDEDNCRLLEMACFAYNWEEMKSQGGGLSKLSRSDFYLHKNNIDVRIKSKLKKSRRQRKKTKITKENIENAQQVALENSCESREYKVVPSFAIFVCLVAFTFFFYQDNALDTFIEGEYFNLENGETMFLKKVFFFLFLISI